MEDWWGYLHVNGSIRVKRYFEERDLTEARQSPFVKTVVGPFPAFGREDALACAREHLQCASGLPPQ